MDTDSSYEDPAEAGEEESSADEFVKPAFPPSSTEALKVVKHSNNAHLATHRKRNGTESREERWNRLQSHYNDQYLNLLNESSLNDHDLVKDDLGSTQLGSTTWSSLEKERFFLALSRRSKADIRGIATIIGSKSELEVYEYLRLLEEEHKYRHLYSTEVDHISHADIPAAAELSIESEALLEEAAEALTVYQDRYDHAIGEQMHQGRWLVDDVQAKAYDELVDHTEGGISSDASLSTEFSIPAKGMFRLSSWLSLTEQVFMNSDPTRTENNWTSYAAEDEVPAITEGAISDLYEIAIHQLRKITQTSIFCAESRIRTTRDRAYTAKALVKAQDVAAAISILGLPDDRSQFWLGLAKRNQLNVVNDYRKKDRGRRTLLTYDQVESILGETLAPHRGRRSHTSASSSLCVSEDSDHVTESGMSEDTDDSDVLGSDRFEPSRDATTSTDEVMEEMEENDDTESSTESSDEELCEDDQDRRLENLDQVYSRRQELQLYHDLGWAKLEDIEVAHVEKLRPGEEVAGMMKRKNRADLVDWRDSITRYVESWEEHGQSLEEAGFAEKREGAKRRRIGEGTGPRKDLPFRSLPR
ncbi:hypothetical protein EPUS_07353 [Endocarpon pusillum Z07020]|uniref:Myb-like domain-containing protein n=1 Tax=Endocarpon pusillum (strain Z07020 / HMAS-L-300199) TaxID=1263415 RepID=U1FZW6_ENDPU|nr:uncharacterized protein EPUS_07353 [Endocarpon pusillum Z07020]ERF70497.1 hypothetical protein EPUS_07353 [Endocarpon pusillum Z07020]